MLLTWKIFHLNKTNWSTDPSLNFTSTPKGLFFLAPVRKQLTRGKANEGAVSAAPQMPLQNWEFHRSTAWFGRSCHCSLMPTSVLNSAIPNWFLKDVFSSFSTATEGLTFGFLPNKKQLEQPWVSLNCYPLLAHTLRQLNKVGTAFWSAAKKGREKDWQGCERHKPNRGCGHAKAVSLYNRIYKVYK